MALITDEYRFLDGYSKYFYSPSKPTQLVLFVVVFLFDFLKASELIWLTRRGREMENVVLFLTLTVR